MTPEAQRIVIAQTCGYKYEPNWPQTIRLKNGYIKFKWLQDGFGKDEPPDYLNDLNAMHEAEKVLKVEQHFTFQVELARVINTITYPLNFALLHSTAAQRAEAFLRTLNLWKD